MFAARARWREGTEGKIAVGGELIYGGDRLATEERAGKKVAACHPGTWHSTTFSEIPFLVEHVNMMVHVHSPSLSMDAQRRLFSASFDALTRAAYIPAPPGRSGHGQALLLSRALRHVGVATIDFWNGYPTAGYIRAEA